MTLHFCPANINSLPHPKHVTQIGACVSCLFQSPAGSAGPAGHSDDVSSPCSVQHDTIRLQSAASRSYIVYSLQSFC